ncbi:hypothetical protein EPIB1_2289 [Tritonibacter mobilis]|nr:hypothetical protein EPIB1_2289 [Tritonibacter mobilis]
MHCTDDMQSTFVFGCNPTQPFCIGRKSKLVVNLAKELGRSSPAQIRASARRLKRVRQA